VSRRIGWTSLWHQAVLFAIIWSLSLSIAYWAITKYDLRDRFAGGNTGDVARYVRMSEGVPLMQIRSPWRFRVLVPLLVRYMPIHRLIPQSVLSNYENVEQKTAQLDFGIVNSVGVALAAWTLVHFLRKLEFTLAEGVIGACFFLLSFPIVNYSMIPLVDGWGYFFTVLGFLGLLMENPLLFGAACSIGLFAKDAVVLLIPVAMLVHKRRSLAYIASSLPGLAIYCLFRFVWFSGGEGLTYTASSMLRNLYVSVFNPSVMQMVFIVQSFTILWILAPIGFHSQSAKPFVRRASPVLALICIGGGVMGGLGDRLLFYGFPVMIPLSLWGLRKVLGVRASI